MCLHFLTAYTNALPSSTVMCLLLSASFTGVLAYAIGRSSPSSDIWPIHAPSAIFEASVTIMNGLLKSGKAKHGLDARDILSASYALIAIGPVSDLAHSCAMFAFDFLSYEWTMSLNGLTNAAYSGMCFDTHDVAPTNACSPSHVCGLVISSIAFTFSLSGLMPTLASTSCPSRTISSVPNRHLLGLSAMMLADSLVNTLARSSTWSSCFRE